jgi:hypothetical protein
VVSGTPASEECFSTISVGKGKASARDEITGKRMILEPSLLGTKGRQGP